MEWRLSALTLLVGIAACCASEHIIPPQGEQRIGSPEDTAVGEPGANREGKLFPVVNIVTFDNGPCVSSNGLHGTCYSKAECSKLGGVSSGTCAKGYGTCCVVRATCSAVITANNTYFDNPGYPSSYSVAGACMVELRPPKGTCQVLLTFVSFDLVPPVAGDCNNDTMVFVGGQTSTPVLCGLNSGQHMYIDVDYNRAPYKIITTLSAIGYARHWSMKVTYLTHKSLYKAPPRCLQYHRGLSGMISSFNYGGTSPQMLNNLNYAICFCAHVGYCDVGLTFTGFELGSTTGVCAGDFVSAGPYPFCGQFSSLAVTVNATGPAVLYVVTDGVNDNGDAGFVGTYMHIAC